MAYGGYRVGWAPDAEAALAVAAQQLPNLLLVDADTQWDEAVGLSRQLRDRFGESTPIVVLSDSFARGQALREIVPQGWLPKPFDLAEFCATLEQLLSPGGRETRPAMGEAARLPSGAPGTGRESS